MKRFVWPRSWSRPLWILVLLMSQATLPGPGFAIEFRTLDGSGNNPLAPEWGSAGQPLLRLHAANYADGIGSVDSSRPNPRVISNGLFDQAGSLPDERGLSNFVWAWGQFIDHDMSQTLISSSNGALGITIPAGDPVFDSGDVHLGGQQIRVSRSNFSAGTGVVTPREQVNDLTSWLDASVVYGARSVEFAAGIDRTGYLRAGSGGRLKVSADPVMGDLLPMYVPGESPEMANTFLPTMDKAFVAGDVRANENPVLLSLQTVFLREHNRLAGLIEQQLPNLSDDEIFQRARKLVGGEIQAVTYHGFLPALGIELPAYTGFVPTVNPAIRNEFANAAFRLGHSQVPGSIARVGENGSPSDPSELAMAEAFFSPSMVLDSGLEPILRGLVATPQQATDSHLIDDLRNQLFQVMVPGIGLVDNATDLASINIMRGRDHGLGTYNQTREALGLPAVASFVEITSDPIVQSQLALVYDALEDIDLYPGLLAEEHLPGSSLGPTAMRILADQFQSLRDGDRFWYENNRDGINDDLLLAAEWNGFRTLAAEDWLEQVTLSEIIQLNTQVGALPANVFLAQPVPEPATKVLLLVGVIAPILARRAKRGR